MFSYIILSDVLIVPISQLQTQQVMPSQVRSHIEYLIQTYYILLLILLSKLMKNEALITVFNSLRFNDDTLAYFFGPPCMHDLVKVNVNIRPISHMTVGLHAGVVLIFWKKTIAQYSIV